MWPVARLLAALCLGAALGCPSAALAHTKLVTSTPREGAKVRGPVKQVQLTFSTTVADTLQKVQIIAPDGSDVAGSPKVAETVVTVPLRGEQPGRMVVSWRTLGADGHPIEGEFDFSVSGTPGTRAPDDATAPRSDDSAERQLDPYPRDTVATVAALARFVFYLTLLAVAGSGIFATMITGRWRPRLFRRACIFLVASSLILFFTNLALAGEYSLAALVNPWNIVPHIATPHGRVTIGCAVLALLLLRGYRKLREGAIRGDNAGRRSFATLSILLAVLPALGGHAMASQSPWLRVPADMLHLLAASVWFGGIVQLQGVASARYSAHPAVFPTVHRFAQLAFASVVVLVLTGAVASWLEIGLDVGELFGSTYGRLVLAKLALLGLTIPLAKKNQQRHVPALRDRTRRSAADLRRYVAFEVMLVMMVIAVTAWLVYETPPRHEKMGHDLRMQH